MARARDIANIINSGTFLTPADQSLVHISTQDFSAVSAINADSIFSSGYKSYILHLNYALSTSTTINLRFRSLGSTDSTSNYNTQTLNMNVTTVAGNRNYGASSAFLTIANGSSGACQMTFINPYTSGKETQWFNHNATGADAALTEGVFAAGTSFDGVSFYPTSGTVNSGTVSVWGLRV